jgi:hypothetical protein
MLLMRVSASLLVWVYANRLAVLLRWQLRGILDLMLLLCCSGRGDAALRSVFLVVVVVMLLVVTARPTALVVVLLLLVVVLLLVLLLRVVVRRLLLLLLKVLRLEARRVDVVDRPRVRRGGSAIAVGAVVGLHVSINSRHRHSLNLPLFSSPRKKRKPERTLDLPLLR